MHGSLWIVRVLSRLRIDMNITFMKNLIQYILVLSLLILAACNTDRKDEKLGVSSTTYTCPMHPQVISAEQGTCPVCAMDLVPVSASGEGNEIMLSASQIQLANIQTKPIRSDEFQTSRVLNGRILPNADMTVLVSSRYAGRVEKLFVKETGRSVIKGQPLFQIYSEEVETLQQDYILQARQMAAFPEEEIYRTLFEAAGNKLKLFGYSQKQIRSLLNQTKASPLITINSSESGVVNEINIAEGQYVAEGTPLIKLENFSELWIEADVYPDEVKSLKQGMSMEVGVNGHPGMKESIKIDFIAPQVDPSSQIVKIRGKIKNKGNLQPGMQVTVLLPGSEKVEGISVPLDAVVREEGGAHVWIKTGKDTFEPRKVTTGNEDATQIIILAGLENVNEVVTSGAYLLTSEFILKKGKNPVTLNHH